MTKVLLSYDKHDTAKVRVLVKTIQKSITGQPLAIQEHCGEGEQNLVPLVLPAIDSKATICVFCVSMEFQHNLACKSLLRQAMTLKRRQESAVDILFAFLHGDYSPLCDSFIKEHGLIARYIKGEFPKVVMNIY